MRDVVSISAIASGGDGVGRLADGMTIFVPRTAPGDTAEVHVVRRKSHYAHGRLLELRSVGQNRENPRCQHYREDDCGGCQLQHLTMPAQLEAKRRFVGDAVRRIGRRLVSDPPITASPTPWRYRTKVTLAVGGGRIGLRRLDQPAEVFDLADCLIVREPLMALWARLSKSRGLLPGGLKSLILREDRAAGLHVVAVGGETCWDAGPLAQDIGDRSICFWWQPGGGVARVVAGRRTGYPATAFEQVNRRLAHAIRLAAVEALGDVQGRVVWDLYGGVGDTAELLADRGARVWTVDCDRSAVEWGQQHGIAGVTRIAGLVEDEVARLPVPFAVVLNPPRTGVGSGVTEWLDRWSFSPGPRVAYVSCDPATLARDIARMPRLAVATLTAYDVFPQTAHVETLAVLEGA